MSTLNVGGLKLELSDAEKGYYTGVTPKDFKKELNNLNNSYKYLKKEYKDLKKGELTTNQLNDIEHKLEEIRTLNFVIRDSYSVRDNKKINKELVKLETKYMKLENELLNKADQTIKEKFIEEIQMPSLSNRNKIHH